MNNPKLCKHSMGFSYATTIIKPAFLSKTFMIFFCPLCLTIKEIEVKNK